MGAFNICGSKCVAQANLAFMYSDGNGVPQNDKEAFEWYLKAAERSLSGRLWRPKSSAFCRTQLGLSP
jgi:TPR repeat protein